MANKEFMSNHEKPNQILDINTKRRYLKQIISGKKTAEGRINSGPFKKVQEGDRINFFNDGGSYLSALCEIPSLERYPGFREMLEGEGYKTMIPDASSLEEAVAAYNSIPTYPERAQKNGVVALRLNVLKITQ